MTEVTVNMDRISADDTTLDLRVNSQAELETVESNVDVHINVSGMTVQVDPSNSDVCIIM